MRPGWVAMFGSGEIAPGAQRVYDAVMRQLDAPVRVAVLETPAGFELNSPRVAGRIAEYLKQHLRNHDPQVTLVPARKRGTPFSPDDPAVIAPLWGSNLLFMGPGSPTYAVRQLRDSLAWQALVARHRLGAALALASAATIALSAWALPVYEIYKVGEALHWQPGLDFWGAYGLSLVLVPHWNNHDGGDELDTSHCFMGRSRFGELAALLPAGQTVVGIDEHTALLVEVAEGRCWVMGAGGVTIAREGGEEIRHEDGARFSCEELGAFRLPAGPEGLPDEVWAQATPEASPEAPAGVTAEVTALVAEREAARQRRDWAAADALRGRIAALGWQVRDTPAGPVVGRI